ncbi:MAG: gamma-butyrobetaine hydroxylase [Gammaproteobacteria bacterium]|jgi:gamma-butyrobetaine hydroxylase
MTVAISGGGYFLSVTLENETRRFHAIWLRDNALNSKTRSPENGQRVITLLDQPAESRIKTAEWNKDEQLAVRFIDDKTQYVYPKDWLIRNSYDNDQNQKTGWLNTSVVTWDRSLQERVPTVDFNAARSETTLLSDWLSDIRTYGFATMTGLPTDSDGLFRVVDLFGFVRETNYGRCFEVRSEINPVNLAYTGLGLQAHTDNPYRDPVPTLQILSCIENTADGGESIVVDGFKAARTLQTEAADHFDLLSEYCARFSYHGSNDVSLTSKRPMIELNPDGELIGIRFNNRSAAPFVDIPFDRMTNYYQAYRHFAEIIERPEHKVSFKLGAGELFIVDNTRVLHSRNAFSSEGTRWLRGCYADRDGLLSTLAVLQAVKTGANQHVA